ncbi:MAG: ABC transporter permease [Bifidobacteriaceae bacterium]|jgi:ABC-2 type transport system permease protein|nr:ABC transporter permease [Bifidobacteriaceae bacterium]
MRAILIFTLTQIKRFFRDPVALFFTILFPLIFLLIFGTIFGNSSNVNFSLAVVNNSQTQISQEFIKQLENSSSAFSIKPVNDLSEAKTKIQRGEIDSIIELPANFGEVGHNKLPSGEIQVYYNPSNPQTGQTIATIMRGIVDKINAGLTQTSPAFEVNEISTGQAGLSQFDYTFSGLLTWTLMVMGLFGFSNQFPSEKKTGALRRIQATPFRSKQMIVGMTLCYTIFTIISVICMLTAGFFIFHWQMQGNWLIFSLFALLGALTMVGIGAAISGWAKNTNQSTPISQIIAFPMMFLSGTFFPRYLMPEWLKSITNWLPLTPINDGLRMITTENQNFLGIWPQLAMTSAWFLIIYIIAFKVFRWE